MSTAFYPQGTIFPDMYEFEQNKNPLSYENGFLLWSG